MSVRKGASKNKSKANRPVSKRQKIMSKRLKAGKNVLGGEIIIDDGRTHHRGRIVNNLAVINRDFGQRGVKRIEINKRSKYGGFLLVTWDDGTISYSPFAGYTVLENWLKAKRTIKGMPVYNRYSGKKVFTV